MLIQIDTLSVTPIYEQLRNQIVFGIASGRLSPGEALPSVRRLAADLGINLHTVNKSYASLSDEGYVAMDRRKGAVIAGGSTNNEEFAARLVDKLILAAAEGICHAIKEKEFIDICKSCYRQAKGSVEHQIIA
ncbi:MAG: GntR family transcriptional regulator [Oscillospiraceae bacterium]|nr:GntR family transcriptional regulator [Oscillospiraceae bacterium]